jgi:hypothetical protein
MADDKQMDEFPLDFHSVLRQLTIISIRAMLAKLQTVTEVNLPPQLDLEQLETRALHAFESKVRDTLRTLGGAR